MVIFFVLKASGVNHVGDIFVSIVHAGFFNEVVHNFFCLVVVTVRGEENANGRAINVTTIVGENFLPVENGGIDMFAPQLWNSSINFSFFF